LIQKITFPELGRRLSDLLQKQYFDIIHLATHSNFNPADPKETGIVLNDGILQARDIFKTIKDDPPWLVFMNACESARIRDLSYFEKYDELSGLGIAFVKAGAPSYIGTNSIINDYSASELAIVFYRNLMRGASVGESLKRSKKAFFDNNPEDLSWAAFVLFGDPTIQKSLEEREEVVCARCHNTNLPGSKYCSSCGLRLDNKHEAIHTPTMQGASVSSTGITRDDFLWYDLPSHGIKISYPSNWMKIEKWQGLKGDLIVVFGPLQERATDPNFEFVGIHIKKLDIVFTIEQYIKLNINNLKLNNPDFVLIDSSPITLAGMRGHRIVCSKNRRKEMHNIILHQNLAYDVGYLADPPDYARYLSIVQIMLDSFEISDITTV
jgi:CHAT domain